MKLLHYVSQAPHTNICNSIMHKDLQNAAISLNDSNSWLRLTTKEHMTHGCKPGFRPPCETPNSQGGLKPGLQPCVLFCDQTSPRVALVQWNRCILQVFMHNVAIIPSLSKSSSLRNQSLYDRSFAVQGPKLWNKVPPTVKADTSFDMFKCSLSNFLALIPDNPPVAGYSCSWSNSLVDYSQGGLKPGLQPCVLFRGQTSPRVALVQWNRCILQVFMHNWITYIRMGSLAHIMQQFHWTRATCGEVWPRKSTHGCKPGFRPPCVFAIQVVRYLMTLPAPRMNSTK